MSIKNTSEEARPFLDGKNRNFVWEDGAVACTWRSLSHGDWHVGRQAMGGSGIVLGILNARDLSFILLSVLASHHRWLSHHHHVLKFTFCSSILLTMISVFLGFVKFWLQYINDKLLRSNSKNQPHEKKKGRNWRHLGRATRCSSFSTLTPSASLLHFDFLYANVFV